MVEIDKILSERSDDRVLKALQDLPDREFYRLVEATLGYIDLKIARNHLKSSLVISECTHRPDGRKFVVLVSRSGEDIGKPDVESLIAFMKRVDTQNGLILTSSRIEETAASLAERSNIGLADGTKLAALMKRFDLDKEAIRAVSLWTDQLRTASIPGVDRRLEEALRMGYESLAARDYMKALDSFDRAIVIKEDYDLPWRLKGNTLDEMGYHEQALGCYKRALELFPESDETWFSLGSCLFALGKYAEEIACYDRALKYNPVMQKALINKGSTLHRLGRYPEALETFDKVLKLNYRLEKVHNNRGATLHSLGKNNEALASYNRAIELRHDYVEAWMNKGTLLSEMGRHSEALDSFNEMTHNRPELPKGWYLRGLAARQTGNISQAKASFDQAVRLDPEYADARKALEEMSQTMAEKYPEVPQIVQGILAAGTAKAAAMEASEREVTAMVSEDALGRAGEITLEQVADEIYGNKAELLLLFGKLEEAFGFLSKSLRLEPEDAVLLTSAGNVLYGMGRFEAAARTYEHALSIDPSYMPAMFNLLSASMSFNDKIRADKASETLRIKSHDWQALAAAALDAMSKEDYKQALDDVGAALALENLAGLLNLKGLLSLDAGDLEAAEILFEKLKTRPMDQSEAYNNCGAVLYRRGELEKASAEFDKAIKIQRNSHAAWNNRGCVLYKVDRLREAIACFEEASVMSPSSVSLTNKGFSQLAMDLVADAVRTFDLSVKNELTAEAYNNKGIALERLGKHDDALAAFNESLRLEPSFRDAQDNARRAILKATPKKGSEAPLQPAPPGEEIFGDRANLENLLPKLDEDYLRTKKKSELEAIGRAMALDTGGTRSELIYRILMAKERTAKE